MLTNRFSIIVRTLILAAILGLGVIHRSNAGDNLEISAAEYKKVEAMMRNWLAMVDKGKYAESFAAASESFRKNLSVEKWAANHLQMLAETGPTVKRGEISSFRSEEKPNNRTLPSSYRVNFKTKFKKMDGTEYLEIVKENGEWKVAHYIVIPK